VRRAEGGLEAEGCGVVIKGIVVLDFFRLGKSWSSVDRLDGAELCTSRQSLHYRCKLGTILPEAVR
jgi:hypothetical protein